MKVLILADPSASHSIKWIKSISNRNVDITVFGLKEYDKSEYSELKNFKSYTSAYKKDLFQKKDGSIKKAIYIKELFRLKKIIKEYNPDIIHAHYATSYGLLGALCGFHPYIVSVWGSDVYNFPARSFIHKSIFKFILSKADRILSTSSIMTREINKYSNKNIDVTPFGIDMDKFYPQNVDRIFKNDDIVIGTIKTLEKKYGIEYLIKAFKIVKDKYPNLPLKLLIVGEGNQTDYLKKLTAELKIENIVNFTGFIKHDDVPKYQNMLDIYATLSIEDSESFGVAVLEASACEKPVVVSNVGGLPEVVENNVTGFVVEKENPVKTAEAIEKLILDKNLRTQLGKNGRLRVIKYYNLKDNLEQMIKIYQEVLI